MALPFFVPWAIQKDMFVNNEMMNQKKTFDLKQ